MREPDHGLTQDDIHFFQSNLLAKAMDEAHVWSCLEDCETKDELAESVLQALAQCYSLSLWCERAFPEDKEPRVIIED